MERNEAGRSLMTRLLERDPHDAARAAPRRAVRRDTSEMVVVRGAGGMRDGVGREVVVAVAGEIDADNADELPARVRAAADGDVDRVVLDVSGVTFIDAAGLRALLICEAQLAMADRGFAVAEVPDAMRRLLQVTGLTHLVA